MKIIESSVQVLDEKDPYKMIELAGRNCYKSEDKITENSAKEFVDRMIKLGHGAMLEHGTIYLAIPITTYAPEAISTYWNNPYSKVNKCDEFIFTDKYGDKVCAWCVTTNLRVLFNILFIIVISCLSFFNLKSSCFLNSGSSKV